MTAQTAQAVDVSQTRYVPWLARYRRTPAGADLRLERIDGGAPDPRASTSDGDGLKVAFRGVLFEPGDLARELGLDPVPESNAELVLYAYRRWGEGAFRWLRGIFALFIWDAERDCLLAARDHLGTEPLFYAQAGGETLFAPSPKTLLAQPGVSRAPNRAVLVESLYARYPIAEETALEGIRRVLPGRVFRVTSDGVSSSKYWDPVDDLEKQGWAKEDELFEFDRLLERSVSRCLDLGSCGVFLSGGLDSVSIAAVARDLSDRRGVAAPWALSLAFPAPEANEEEVQRGVAKALGLPQLMLGLEDSVAPSGFIRRALELSAEWPLPRTYIWAGAYQSLAEEAVNRGARVIMTGAGGDEWLTVDLHLAADFIQSLQIRNLVWFTRSRLASFSASTLPALRYMLWRYGLREVLAFHTRRFLATHAPEVLWARRRRVIAAAEVAWVAPDPALGAEVKARREADIRRFVDRPKLGGRFTFYSADGNLIVDHPLIAADREHDFEFGRRAGAELVHPYWEPDLISFLYRVPPELLLRGGREKGLVRGTIARRFPGLGFERQKKVLSTGYQNAIVRREGPDAVRRLGGCRVLAELGVVDGVRADAFVASALASSDTRQLYGAWDLLNLETWVRSLVEAGGHR